MPQRGSLVGNLAVATRSFEECRSYSASQPLYRGCSSEDGWNPDFAREGGVQRDSQFLREIVAVTRAGEPFTQQAQRGRSPSPISMRSEERRVGKEGRS